MRNPLLSLFLSVLCSVCLAQNQADKDAIFSVLNTQVAAWNEGKIDRFMEGYWQSDSLMFVGKSGVTYGYLSTYENYVKRYPDRATMGTLKFEFINISFPSAETAFLVGKFYLSRPAKGDLSGFYTLLWKKIKGKWYIVCDHTS
ncbi:hypothetical protein DYBT9275_04521 [Dyadobacter sp. CECT 9275]|uniref:DUF4440 domain-containing protein n=1 Tax=Dyadobacter helix TaxID=2822344 RepID=A0A916N7M3_9BACT|nr:nuclear transport factor 2 family protein [Dyadobacter sp. CECT 9275]CAG5009542.1 hypothetical protein DYBT9275_04521 [Dyadobacter sp. CECT 9275]